ncbi:MAG: PGF-pre-PGF domain-containing protein, partial [Nanoarchaeota archaeon]|nr:PGF-pre-PGF domain-containing protein [Nanoarchaeota archaeon]
MKSRTAVKKNRRNNIISIILTLVVISMYLFPNFASAVQVYITTDKTTYDHTDDVITFNMSVDIADGELVPIQNVTLKINGTYKTCTFLPNGTFLTSCSNLQIISKYVAPTSYGYGYGYGVDIGGANQTTYFGYGYGYGYATGRTGYSGEITFIITWNITADSAPNGAYTVKLDVYAEDNGESYTYSSSEANFGISKDGTPPSVTINSPANNAWINDATPEISFTITDNNDTTLDYTIFVDGTANGQTGTATNGTAELLNLSTLSQGARTIIVEAADDAGNKANSTPLVINIDTANPSATINSPANNTWTTDTTPEISFTLTDNLDTTIDYTIFVDGTAGQTGTATNGTAKLLNLSTLSQGARTIIVEAADEATNKANSTPLVINVDTDGLSSTINSPANNTWTTDTTPEISFTLTDNLDTTINYTIFVDGTANGQTGTATNGTAKLLNLSTLSQGARTIIVEAADEAGNKVNSTARVINVDTANPSAVINSPANNSWTSDTTPEISFTLTDNLDTVLNYTIFINETANVTGTDSNGTAKLVNLSTLTDGVYSIKVEAADEAGNKVNSTALALNVDNTPPVISAFTLSDNTPRKNQDVTGTCTVTDNSESFGGSVTTNITGIDTTTTGSSRTATCTATDSAGNNVTSTASYSVHSVSSGGGGTYTPPNPQKASVWTKVSPENPVTMNVNNADIDVLAITLNVKNELSNVEIKVELLPGKPASIPTAPIGKVYEYMEISTKNLKNDDLEGTATIEFRVKKSWLTQNGVSKENVVLQRYTTNWDDLPTSVQREDSEYVYFTAQTHGFSIFAIGTKEPTTVTPPPVTPPAEPPVVTPPVVQPPAVTPPAEPPVTPPAEPPAKTASKIWMYLLLVLIVAAIAFFYFKKPPKIKEERLRSQGVFTPHQNHEKLDSFMKKELEEGHSKATVKKALLKAGWKKELVEEHMK